MDYPIEAQKVIDALASKLGTAEAENVVLQLQVQEVIERSSEAHEAMTKSLSALQVELKTAQVELDAVRAELERERQSKVEEASTDTSWPEPRPFVGRAEVDTEASTTS